MAHYIAPPPCAPEHAADYARQCAAEWVSDQETVLLDTETTSLDGWPVEVAVLDMSGRVLFDSLMRAPAPVEDSARAVHGITDEELRRAPRARRVLDQLAAVLVGKRVLAYNARFDRGVLSRAYTAEVQALPLWREWGCVMELASWRAGQWADDGRAKAVRLESAEHRALGDCRAALAVLHRLNDEGRKGT